MRIFLDANILVAVLCNEYPLFSFCARVLSLCDNPAFKVYTSPVCLAIAFYFAEKKNGNKLARKKIALLCDKMNIASIDEGAVKMAVSDKAMNDFEDGLEYYAALNSDCSCIITQDKGDFYFSKMEVLNAEEFLMKYAVKRK